MFLQEVLKPFELTVMLLCGQQTFCIPPHCDNAEWSL